MIAAILPRLSAGPGTEQGRADPQQIGTLGNGRFQITGHAHGQGIQLIPIAAELFIKLAQHAKGFALRRKTFPWSRQAHQTPQAQARQSGNHCGQLRYGLGRTPRLLGFPIHIDLETNLQWRQGFRALAAEPAGDLDPVHRLHPVELLRHRPGRVGLQGTDEMPARRRIEVGEFADLGFGLGQVILTEGTLAEFLEGADPGRGVGLGNRQDLDLSGIPVRGPCRFMHPAANRVQTGSRAVLVCDGHWFGAIFGRNRGGP